MKKIIIFLVAVFLISGCTFSVKIAMKSSLNDFLVMSIKTNSKLPVSYQYRSNVRDGETVARDPDFKHVRMIHTESTSFMRMLDEYMNNKFVKIHRAAETKIMINLADFYLDRKLVESKGLATMQTLVGAEQKQQIYVYVKISVQVIYKGKEHVKNISVSEEDSYVASRATRGRRDAFQFIYGELINKANNKALMVLNRFSKKLEFNVLAVQI